MKLIVATTNKAKKAAVTEACSEYDFLKEATVISVRVESGVSEQPMSLEETVQGAVHRATRAFSDCKYSFGLESGLVQVPGTKTGYMDIGVCAIYDGKDFHMGLSSAFELPKSIFDIMIKDELDISSAWFAAGLTDKQKIGNDEGVIGQLTNGRLTRKGQVKQSIINALIHLENEKLYRK